MREGGRGLQQELVSAGARPARARARQPREPLSCAVKALIQSKCAEVALWGEKEGREAIYKECS